MKIKIIAVLGFLMMGTGAYAGDYYEGYSRNIVTADQMTCAQAVSYYETYGRIYVIAHGKNVLPIYGKTPISKARSLRCTGRSQSKWVYNVKTLDDRTCGIAVYCQ